MGNLKLYFKNLFITFAIIAPSYVMFKYILGVDELKTSDVLIPFMCTLMLLNYLVLKENETRNK